MHEVFSLPANNGYRVGMKEIDGKLHVSNTSVGRLIPLRNRTTVSSHIGVRQELAEQRNSNRGTHRPRPFAGAGTERCGYRSWDTASYSESRCSFTAVCKEKCFVPERDPHPSQPVRGTRSSGTRTASRWHKPEPNLLGEESWPSWREYSSSSSPPCSATTDEHAQQSLSFSHQ